MNVPRKPDSERIRAHIKHLKEQPWVGKAQRWWPDYLFRVDDITAAAKILNDGYLLSRKEALAAGVLVLDCASPNVIAATAEQWKDYVRLYFRPKTPTEYLSEGFRPAGSYELGAHRPVPIVMLFDAADILTRADAEFSDGNLAAGAATGNDYDFLCEIPFEQVYHDRSLDESEKRSIVFRRHAEVIVPRRLDLSSLRYIVCRTQAEYETLLHLLQPTAVKRWSRRISQKTNMHYRFWTFVEQVELNNKRILFRFNPSSQTPGPFSACVSILEDATRQKYLWEDGSYHASSQLEISLDQLQHPEGYSVRLELDGQLAYSNHYAENNLPF